MMKKTVYQTPLINTFDVQFITTLASSITGGTDNPHEGGDPTGGDGGTENPFKPAANPAKQNNVWE